MTDIPDEAVEALCSEFGMEPEFARAVLTAAYPHLRHPLAGTGIDEDYVRSLESGYDEFKAENARLRSRVDAVEKELAIANRVIMRHLPDLVEAVRAEVAALSDEGKP